jgi:hypothetical protein
MLRQAGIMIVFLSLVVLLLGACGDKADEADQVNEPQSGKTDQVNEPAGNVLYENNNHGLKVFEAEGWTLKKESTADPLSVVFTNGRVDAIISVLGDDKSFQKIKEELKAASGSVQVTDEKEDSLSYRSDRKESIRTDVFLRKGDGRVFVITFMTPNASYEANAGTIHDFQKHIRTN